MLKRLRPKKLAGQDWTACSGHFDVIICSSTVEALLWGTKCLWGLVLTFGLNSGTNRALKHIRHMGASQPPSVLARGRNLGFKKKQKQKCGPFNQDGVEWSYFLHLFMYARRDRYSDTCPTTIRHLFSGNKTAIVDEFPVSFRVFIFSLQFYQDKKNPKNISRD